MPRPDPSDFLAFVGFSLITVGSVALWGFAVLLLAGAVLLGFAVWSSLRLANLEPPKEPEHDGDSQ
jgi:hypothetical protein